MKTDQKTCVWCGNLIGPEPSNRKVCGKECRIALNRKVASDYYYTVVRKKPKPRDESLNLKRRQSYPNKPLRSRGCSVCNQVFTTNLPQKTRCSVACQKAHYKKCQAKYRKGVKANESYKTWFKEWRKNKYSKTASYKASKAKSKRRETRIRQAQASISNMAKLSMAIKIISTVKNCLQIQPEISK
jgi:hypothetical protein